MNIIAYKDGTVAHGMNIRRNGEYGKVITVLDKDKFQRLPNKGLKVAMWKKL